MKNERKKIQTDEVLSQGTKFHPPYRRWKSGGLMLKIGFSPTLACENLYHACNYKHNLLYLSCYKAVKTAIEASAI